MSEADILLNISIQESLCRLSKQLTRKEAVLEHERVLFGGRHTAETTRPRLYKDAQPVGNAAI